MAPTPSTAASEPSMPPPLPSALPTRDAREEELSKLGTKELLARLKAIGMKLTRDERKTKPNIVHAILSRAPEHELAFLSGLARQKDSPAMETSRKRKRQNIAQTSRRTAPRIDPEPVLNDEDLLDDPISQFLRIPTENELLACYRDFYEATSNTGVAFGICAVCARERSVHDDGLELISISDIPNPTRLTPASDLQHPEHKLINGMLLDEAGITRDGDSTSVAICQQCEAALKDSRSLKPPKYSLANNMWIGGIPLQLRTLTFSEQLLIAVLYPRVFVFKLSPKRAHGRRDQTMQRGIRGNVSTYEQDIEGIASMTQGNLMPRPPAILASIMSVTFIGTGSLPKDWLHSTFRVRRRVVLDALSWLKEHNPKYYGNIEISDARIGQLPEDNVPDEILANVRQSTDIGVLDEEHSGYVPREDEEPDVGNQEDESRRHNEHARSNMNTSMQEHEDGDEPDVIPLHVSGVLDTDLSNMTASELMSYGLANLWEEGLEGGYAIFAGEKIDLDAFMATLGPDKVRRAENIASDPYAAATFFHFMIGVILETLFKVKVTGGNRVSSGTGVFGRIAAYFGTVESQARGTLHLHMLLWLEGSPSADEMDRLLKSEEFCQRIKDYIDANMRAYLPGFESEENVKSIPNEVEIAYSRPPNPDSPDYKQELKTFELRVARAKQVHSCEMRRCLLPNGRGGLRCKRRAPFELAKEAFMNEAGEWGPKRLYEFMNNWNPSISICVRCNNDCKLLPNGRDTKNVTFYVTGYSAKKQGKNHNVSALVAKGHAFHVERSEYIDNLLDDQRKLLIRVLQRINREQELAAVMVISYLMGWGDTFKSHHYTAIFWSSFVGALLKAFPNLKLGVSSRSNIHDSSTRPSDQSTSNSEEEPNIEDQLQSRADRDAQDAEDGNDVVTLDSDSSGHLYTKCQMTDYGLRGDELSDYNVMEFFVNTIPMMTMISKDDLAGLAINVFAIGVNILTECESAAREHGASADSSALPHQSESVPDENLELGEDAPPTATLQGFTEEGLAALQADQTSPREALHAHIAVQHALHAGIFTDDIDQGSWTARPSSDIGIDRAEENHLHNLLRWKEQMESDVTRQNTHSNIPLSSQPSDADLGSSDGGRVSQLREQDPDSFKEEEEETGPLVASLNAGSEIALLPVAPSELKTDQRRAYEFVTWHLEQHLAGMPVPPLRLLIHGEGGTGKSKVIQTITEYFATRRVSHKLIKAAYTGVAASLIDGKTTHTIGMISQRGNQLSDESKAKLSEFWTHYEYLILDECSMLSKTFLAKLSRHIGVGKQKPGASNSSLSFGGINVILCGDFHQFPPVAVANHEALYLPADLTRDSLDSQIGRAIYEEFKDVIILKEQMRVTDSVWHKFLQNLRYGRIQQDDLDMLRTLIISNPNCPPIDFAVAPWDSAALVTPRHAVRKQWNEAATRKHCEKTGQRMFICKADDAVNDRAFRPLTLAERYGVAIRAARTNVEGGNKKKRRQDLPETIELSVGMNVMVTTNVETDLDVTNGARGDVVGIVLHPEEPAFGDEPIVHLKHLPIYILVKMRRTRATRLAGLDESVIPIEPGVQTFQIKIPTRLTKANTRRVRRRQFPMTAAYAFTDYRSQGQTIPHVIVDIASPPSGKLSLFNLYVALSRSSGRDTIRLLRDFDDDKFLASHRPELAQEDDRLMRMDEATKEWWSKMRQR
ncbi:hypothetical protein EWM64_g2158 [Hericium alpestre]|uniref:ATP-dependent DNA helicase n=1 Tax=Hericium alpestre TaxID=135208 RepID=A0A4Z0A550_9AGAM|nr:hypothetical protein EWM64_g2158 [Hericium alpestre]